MAKKNKGKNKQTNHQFNHPKKVEEKEKSPEVLALEQEIERLKSKLFEKRNEKAGLDKQKQAVERELKNIQSKQDQQHKKINELEKSAFEVRNAIRVIGELDLTKQCGEVDPEILDLIQLDYCDNKKMINSQNDEQILAIAAFYKLNDLILYTEDKNLKNKANKIGIKTA